MRKILWLVSWYPNRKDPSDGDFIQRQARAAARYQPVHVIYLTKAGWRVNGLFETECRTEGNLTEQIVYYKSPSGYFPWLHKLVSQLRYRRVFKQLVRDWMAKEGPPALVHVHVAAKAGMAALWMQQQWGTKFILTEHWTGYYSQSKPNFYDQHPALRRLTLQVLKKASLLLPVSHNLGTTISRDFTPVDFEVVPNVVDTAHFFPGSSPAAPFRFLHVSYLHYQKNPQGIIAAAAALYRRGYSFELQLLGRKDKVLEELALSSGLPASCIQFTEAVAYEEVALAMQQANAFVLFSRFENLPCVLLEAGCCGLPVISTNVGGISEQVNATNGILVESEDVEGLANAMQEMIEHYQRFDKKQIAAEAAAKFNYDTVGKQLQAVYQRLGL